MDSLAPPGNDITTPAMAVSPSTVERAGREIADLAAQLDVPGVDTSLLSSEAIGHPRLAQALRDFTEQCAQHVEQLRSHLRTTGEETQMAGLNYHEADSGAAEQLHHRSDAVS